MEHITLETKPGAYPGAADLRWCYTCTKYSPEGSPQYKYILYDWFVGGGKMTPIQVFRSYLALRDWCVKG